MEVLTIISSSPYGNEKIRNALRLAEALCCSEVKVEVNIFLIGDAVNAAKRGQKPPKGFYNLEKMLADLVKVGVSVEVCHTSMNLRGLTEQDLVSARAEEDLEAAPEGSNMGLGCGNPVALTSLKEGEIVVDLGSGARYSIAS
jgi:uncharacterized protein involved in oxidation of intracellular sulfur